MNNQNNQNNITGSGILPYVNIGRNRYYLIGREHPQQDWSNGDKWADFGGAIEGNLNPFENAIKEFEEETLNIFNIKKENYDEFVDYVDLNKYRCYLLNIESSFKSIFILNDEKHSSDKVKLTLELLNSYSSSYNRIYQYLKGSGIFKQIHGKPGFMAVEHKNNKHNNFHAGLFEKSKLKWIKDETLFKSCGSSKSNQKIKTNASKTNYSIRPRLQKICDVIQHKQANDIKKIVNTHIANFNHKFYRRVMVPLFNQHFSRSRSITNETGFKNNSIHTNENKGVIIATLKAFYSKNQSYKANINEKRRFWGKEFRMRDNGVIYKPTNEALPKKLIPKKKYII